MTTFRHALIPTIVRWRSPSSGRLQNSLPIVETCEPSWLFLEELSQNLLFCERLVKGSFLIRLCNGELSTQVDQLYDIVTVSEARHDPAVCLGPVKPHSLELGVNEEDFLNRWHFLIYVSFDASAAYSCARREYLCDNTGGANHFCGRAVSATTTDRGIEAEAVFFITEGNRDSRVVGNAWPFVQLFPKDA